MVLSGIQPKIRPEVPSDLGFPAETFPAWRRYQLDTIMQISEKLNTNSDTVILGAPTGAGKSILSVAVARLNQTSALILVGTKQLAEQYETSLKDIVVMKGRNNYPCAIRPDLTADLAPCSLQRDKEGQICRFKKEGGCLYYDAKRRAERAPIVVTSYAYGLNELNWIGKFRNRGLLICDEAHRIERALMSWVGISFTRKLLLKYGIKLPRLSYFSQWRAWAETTYPIAKLTLETEKAKDDIFSWDRKDLRDLQRFERAVQGLGRLAKLKETWLIDYLPYAIRFKPIWVKDSAESALFGWASQSLLMSATPPFPRSLGLENYGHIEVPSTFPVKNRPLIYEPRVKLSYNRMRQELPRLVALCDRMMEKHKNQKGLLHTFNYKIRDAILVYSKYPERLVTHDSRDRIEALEKFMASDEPLVLVSPSMNEGVSFDDELARWAVICKLGFPDRSDPQVKARAAEDQEWYLYETANNLIQTYGRLVRSETDWGTNYLFDSNYTWLLKRHRKLFPKWFLESLIWRR